MADEHDIGGKTEKPPEIPGRPSRPSAAVEKHTEDAAVTARGEAQVNDLRRRIDQIDDQLMKLLNSRSACAVEIGRIKRHIGMPVYQPEREKWILDRVERNNPGPLDRGAVRRVFERVIDESRRLERLAGNAEERRTALARCTTRASRGSIGTGSQGRLGVSRPSTGLSWDRGTREGPEGMGMEQERGRYRGSSALPERALEPR